MAHNFLRLLSPSGSAGAFRQKPLRRNRGTVSEDLNTSKINPFYAASIPTGLAEPPGSGQQPLNHTAFVVVLLVAVGKMADFFYQNFSAFVSRFDSLPAGSAMCERPLRFHQEERSFEVRKLQRMPGRRALRFSFSLSNAAPARCISFFATASV